MFSIHSVNAKKQHSVESNLSECPSVISLVQHKVAYIWTAVWSKHAFMFEIFYIKLMNV